VRYFPEYAAAHRSVSAGEIGTPTVLRFRRAGSLPPRAWLRDEQRSGGVIGDLMVHDLDQARWFAGEVIQVNATAARPVGGTRTHAYAILTHAGGARSHVTASWALADGFETSFEITGSTGVLDYDSTRAAPPLADRPGLAGPDGLPLTTGEDPFHTQLADFAATIHSGQSPRVTAADAAAALSLSLAATESARTGRAVVPEPLPAVFARRGWG
jgi:myo-inositol 2-dehydrogenase/D-chiro-inositol 1-dehydrogenase